MYKIIGILLLTLAVSGGITSADDTLQSLTYTSYGRVPGATLIESGVFVLGPEDGLNFDIQFDFDSSGNMSSTSDFQVGDNATIDAHKATVVFQQHMDFDSEHVGYVDSRAHNSFSQTGGNVSISNYMGSKGSIIGMGTDIALSNSDTLVIKGKMTEGTRDPYMDFTADLDNFAGNATFMDRFSFNRDSEVSDLRFAFHSSL